MTSKTERARRREQAAHAPKKSGPRAERRRAERTGVAILHDPNTTFKLTYSMSVPGGLLRGEHPEVHAGTLTAESEADLLRGIVVKAVEAFGFIRRDTPRAVTGLFAEMINPMSMALRQMILMQIAQGTGLSVYVMGITRCKDCGAEQDITEIIDPHAPEDAQLETQDTTVHAEGCPTHCPTQPIIPNDPAECKPVEWETVPALMIDHPAKYQPLTAPREPSVAIEDFSEDAAEPVEVTEEDEGVVDNATQA